MAAPDPALSNDKRAARILTALVIGLIALAGVYGLRVLRETQQQVRAASCANDVYELFRGIRGYAEARDGLTPPISPIRGNLMMDPEGFYPEFLSNSCWTQCEYSPVRDHPDGDKNDDLGRSAFNDDSFVYLPWEVRTEEEGLAFVEAYKTLDFERRDEDLVVEIDGKARTLPRTRLNPAVVSQGRVEGEPDIPILIEWPDHYHSGATVYYTNGYSRVNQTLNDGFPMTKDFIKGLHEIASVDRPVPE